MDEDYKEKLRIWADRRQVIIDFDQAHPYRQCSIHRQGENLRCRTCNVEVHAPAAGPRPKDPMEASLSRFD